MTEPTLLVGDMGGTNARFALAERGTGYYAERVFTCLDYPTPEDAIRAYLEDLDSPVPQFICIAAAGPIVDNCCRFTNSPWALDADALRATFNARGALLINDFAAIAYGLAGLSAAHCAQVGPVPAKQLAQGDFTVGVLGPGTGLGVAGLLRRGQLTTPLVTEAGHGGFAAETDLQRAILQRLQSRFERVSIERILSGTGLVNLYSALADVEGADPESASAADIFARSRDHAGTLERRCTDLFFEILGQVTGDLAMAFGAEQGMYIAGGIVQRYPRMLAASGFRSGFENKGRHRALLERIPTLLIEHPYPGLFGTAERARTLALEQVLP